MFRFPISAIAVLAVVSFPVSAGASTGGTSADPSVSGGTSTGDISTPISSLQAPLRCGQSQVRFRGDLSYTGDQLVLAVRTVANGGRHATLSAVFQRRIDRKWRELKVRGADGKHHPIGRVRLLGEVRHGAVTITRFRVWANATVLQQLTNGMDARLLLRVGAQSGSNPHEASCGSIEIPLATS